MKQHGCGLSRLDIARGIAAGDVAGMYWGPTDALHLLDETCRFRVLQQESSGPVVSGRDRIGQGTPRHLS